MNRKIGINATLNVIKSALSVLFPLITYPYALRVLGAEGIGRVTYGQSIISYFSLIAMLGVASYGVREGAKRKCNKSELQKFINEVFTINITTTFLSYGLLFVALLCFRELHDYSSLILLQSLSIILTTMGVDWINTVYEDYFMITIRSVITHVISLVLLFILIKTADDYFKYAFLTVLSNGIVCISNWFYIRRYIRPKITLHPNIGIHIKPLLLMFSNAIAVSVYVNFDITMLGWIKGDYSVGLYAVAVKVYTIVKSIMQAIYAVTIPRLASYVGEGKRAEYKELYTDLWGYLALLLIPAGIGLACISEEVMLFMGGEEFVSASGTLQILSMSLIFAIFGGLVTAVLNITIGKEKDNLIATILSAAINCGLNLIFIPLFSQNGAAITTLISEIFVFVFCVIRVRNIKEYLDYKAVIKSFRDAVLGSLGIIGYAIMVKSLFSNSFARVFLIIIGSLLVYGLIVLSMKNSYAYKQVNNMNKKLRKVLDYMNNRDDAF